MANELNYIAWRRSALFDLAQPVAGRMQGHLPLRLRDESSGDEASGAVPITFTGPGDIGGLEPHAIKHMAPPPMARDAETTKFVHIDFYDPDLPWRYTPQPAFVPLGAQPDNLVVAPWLVLLVGTAIELKVKDNQVEVAKSVLTAHDLRLSYRWAHVQEGRYNDEERAVTISRLLSPVTLLPQHAYVAALVPAFDSQGQPLWNGDDESRTLPLLHSWRFWTGEAGDFETLAQALRLHPAGDAGKAILRYRRQVAGIDETLEVYGAIRSLQDPAPPPQNIETIHADLESLNDQVDGAIGMPHYGRPWLPEPDEIVSGWPNALNDDPRHRAAAGLGVWMAVEGQEALVNAAVAQAGALPEAGRLINHLALGLLAAGRLWQKRLPADPVARLHVLGPMMARLQSEEGDIVLDRVTGDDRTLPPAIFSGAAQRLLRDRSPHTHHIGGADRVKALSEANEPPPSPEPAPPGLPHFLTTRTSFADGVRLEEVLGLDENLFLLIAEHLAALVAQFAAEYANDRNWLRKNGREDEVPQLRHDMAEGHVKSLLEEALAEHLPQIGCDCSADRILIGICAALATGGIVGWSTETQQEEPICPEPDDERIKNATAWLERVLEEELVRETFLEVADKVLRFCSLVQRCEELAPGHIELGRKTFCNDLLEGLAPPPRSRQRGINLGALGGALSAALDPRGPHAPARRRVCSRIEGIDCSLLTRPRFPIGLDFPTWTLLNRYDREWLLPGASQLEKDSITALQTNPAFVDAFMSGINSQFLAEMLWRDLAADRSSTPLRMFWGQVDYATGKRVPDVEPLAEWAKDTAQPLGALAHQTLQPAEPTENSSGSRLVIVFNSALFRRYKGTLVYLLKPAAGDDIDDLLRLKPDLSMPPGDATAEAIQNWRRGRKFFGPALEISISSDIRLFIFDVTPSTLDEYWLVLAEPRAELRFRNYVARDETNSATFADSTLDQETRVAISGRFLEEQAHL